MLEREDVSEDCLLIMSKRHTNLNQKLTQKSIGATILAEYVKDILNVDCWDTTYDIDAHLLSYQDIFYAWLHILFMESLILVYKSCQVGLQVSSW